MSDLSITIHNERTKITATYLNGLAIAILAVGGLAPSFSALYNDNGQLASPLLAIGVITCFIFSFTLHSWARRVLKELKS